MDVPRRLSILLVLLLALVGTQAPYASADEEIEDEEEVGLLACGDRLCVEIPAAWQTNEDPRGRWAEARDPADAALRVRLSRHFVADAETPEGFRSRHLAGERSAAFEGAGSWFEERREAGTLVVRPLADPPVLTLYVHAVRGGEGQVLQADVPLHALPEHYDRASGMCAEFRDQRPAPPLVPPSWPRRFTHEIPEEISWRGHPFLRVVEAATAKGVFRYEESAAWVQAMNAWAETLQHAARLAEDPAYRAANGMFANVAHYPPYEAPHRAVRWVEPYALVWMSQDPLSGAEQQRLGERALVLTQVYRIFLAHFGKELGLRDFMAPGGGGSSRPGVRSFPDGAPLLVVCRAGGPQDWDPEYQIFGAPRQGAERQGLLDRQTGALTVYAAVEDAHDVPALDAVQVEAEMAAHQLLWWFSRQMNRWGRSGWSETALAYGTAAWIGGVRPAPSGRLDHTGVNVRLLGAMRAFASQFSESGKPYPFVPLRDLLRFEGQRQVATWGQAKLGVPAAVAWQLFRQQAWAFVTFLDEAHGGKRRTLHRRLLQSLCRREMDFGQGLPSAQRILGIQTQEAWEELDAEFQRWVHDDLWKRETEARHVAEWTPEREDEEDAKDDAGPLAFLAVHLEEDGSRRLNWSYSPYGRDWNAEEATTAPDEPDAMLRNLFRRLADLPGVQGAGGSAGIEVVIEADDVLGWDAVQNVAHALAPTGIEPQAMHVVGITSALDFPRDDELPPEGSLDVVLLYDPRTPETTVTITGYGSALHTYASSENLPSTLKAFVADKRNQWGFVPQARIRFAPAVVPLPPVGDVRTLLQALVAAGLSDLFIATPKSPPPGEPDSLGAHDVTVRLQADGTIVIVEPDGNELGPFALGTGTPEEQRKGLSALRKALAALAADAPREADGTSTARILIEGDRRARWQYVQWIMQIAADPKVRIYKIQFRVRGP